MARAGAAVPALLLCFLAATGAATAASDGICSPGNGAHPPVYLTLASSGLVRLELSPSVPNGLATVPVSRTEIAALCASGLDIRLRGHGALPADFSIVRRNGAVYGNLWTGASTPAGASAQWAAFDLRSQSFAGKGEHAPVALFLDAQALNSAVPEIVGNGMLYGEVQLAPNGCGGPSAPGTAAFNTEVEAYWASGNRLWSESCGGVGLADGAAYHLVLQAGTDGSVSYVNSTGGSPVGAAMGIATLAARPSFVAANGGVLVAATNFCPACGDFALDFTHAVTGWSIAAPSAAAAEPDVPLRAGVRSLSFSAQQQGTPGPARQVAFVNVGATPVDVTFAVIGGDGPHCGGVGSASACAQEIGEAQRSYAVTATGCSPVLSGATCTASVTFTPQAAFRLTAVLAWRAGDTWLPTVDLEGAGLPRPSLPGTVPAVEYFDPALEHYFVTTLPSETSVLDAGTIAGWIRTGQWFWAYPGVGDPSSGRNPACRLYGLPAAGLDTHFYSASPDECAAALERFAGDWILETTDLFDIALPNTGTGACAPGLVPVYRLYNGKRDANHRYTVDAGVRSSMLAAGWIAEGYGTIGIAMCAPAP